MCFSSTASFTAAAILIPTGFYSAFLALKHNKSLFFFSLVPLFFGIQQLLEGFVWVKLTQHHPFWAHVFATCYLFFAFALWPSYLAFSIAYAETNTYKKRLFQLMGLAGIILAGFMYLPILLNKQNLNIHILNHSICYVPPYSFPLGLFYEYFYLSIILFVSLLSTNRHLKYFGVLVLFSYLVSNFWYQKTFISVWCFFAAILSIYVIVIVRCKKTC